MHQTHFLTPTSNQRLAQLQREASAKFWTYCAIAGLTVVNVGLYALRSFS